MKRIHCIQSLYYSGIYYTPLHVIGVSLSKFNLRLKCIIKTSSMNDENGS